MYPSIKSSILTIFLRHRFLSSLSLTSKITTPILMTQPFIGPKTIFLHENISALTNRQFYAYTNIPSEKKEILEVIRPLHNRSLLLLADGKILPNSYLFCSLRHNNIFFCGEMTEKKTNVR